MKRLLLVLLILAFFAQTAQADPKRIFDVVDTDTTISAGTTYTSSTYVLDYADGYFALQVDSSACSTAAGITPTYQMSLDGTSWADQTADAIAEDLTNASGTAGVSIYQVEVPFCLRLRWLVENGSSADYTGTVTFAWE